jgi:hypothetical protein
MGNDAVLRGTTGVFFHPSTVDLHHNQPQTRLGNPTGRLAHPWLPSLLCRGKTLRKKTHLGLEVRFWARGLALGVWEQVPQGMLAKVREQVPQMGLTGEGPHLGYRQVPLPHRAHHQTGNRPRNVHQGLHGGLL